jgi:hypothetical protein
MIKSGAARMIESGNDTITIKNLRNEQPRREYDIRVDRRTIFGNPFKMWSEEDRDYVCDEHKKYFKNKVEKDKEFKQALDELVYLYERYGTLNLFCWCAPKRCHSETIKEYILEAARNKK